MDFLNNEFILENFSQISRSFLIAFVLSLLIAPVVGRFAKAIGAIDLPASMRSSEDKSALSRINIDPKIKLGGLGIVIGLLASIWITDSFDGLNTGIYLGLAVVMFFAFWDDYKELNGKIHLLGQILAAGLVVAGGISVTKITFLSETINLDLLDWIIQIGELSVQIVFPADLLTIIWIVAIMNFINWVGGIDALNPTVTAIIASTMMLFALNSQNIVLAVIIAAHVGALVGYIPYNYNPSKSIQGSTGDMLNGYLLAVFAIVGGTRWSSTFILLALPILDALVVILKRVREHPEVLRKPWRLLSISDKNHLHHRLLEAGYSRKTILFIESTIVLAVCAIAIYFSGIREDFVAFVVALSFIAIVFALIVSLQNNRAKKEVLRKKTESEQVRRKASVRVVTDKDEEEEKFIY